MVTEIYTIGVYGKTEETFFSCLTNKGIDAFCDIRRRRAVRGSTYAFVNSTRLQQKLALLNISYLHFLELAPSIQTREIEKYNDHLTGIKKRNREILSDDFVNAYKAECLLGFDTNKFLSQFDNSFNKIVLFCVEASANACHRSLVAQKLSDNLNIPIINL